jgi:YD repeat-containing protein
MWDFGPSPSRTQQYDASGRVASYSIPSGTYSNLTYDAEGDLSSYVGYNGVAVGYTWNNRGELVGQSFSPDPVVNGYTAWPAFAWDSFQGNIVRAGAMAYDARTGAPIQIDTGTFTYDAIGRVAQAANPATSATFKYDAENRLLSGSSSAIMDTGTCGSGLFVAGASRNLGYTYGPDGHIAQDVFVDPALAQHTRQWHWAQDTLAYTATDARVDAMNADDIGVIPPNGASPGLTVYDRDLYGLVTSKHNYTGHDAWTAPNPYLAPCVSQNPPPASPGYVSPFGGVGIPASGQTDDGSNLTDSSSSRSVSTTSSTYMTPSAASTTPYASGTRHLLLSSSLCPSGTHRAEGGQCIDNSYGPLYLGTGPIFGANPPHRPLRPKPPKPAKPLLQGLHDFMCDFGPGINGGIYATGISNAYPNGEPIPPGAPTELQMFRAGFQNHPSAKAVVAGSAGVATVAFPAMYVPPVAVPAAIVTGGSLAVNWGASSADAFCPDK